MGWKKGLGLGDLGNEITREVHAATDGLGAEIRSNVYSSVVASIAASIRGISPHIELSPGTDQATALRELESTLAQSSIQNTGTGGTIEYKWEHKGARYVYRHTGDAVSFSADKDGQHIAVNDSVSRTVDAARTSRARVSEVASGSTSPVDDGEINFCGQCGTPWHRGGNFCGSCGDPKPSASAKAEIGRQEETPGSLRDVVMEKIMGTSHTVASGDHLRVDKVMGGTLTVQAGARATVGKLMSATIVIERGGSYSVGKNLGGIITDHNLDTGPSARESVEKSQEEVRCGYCDGAYFFGPGSGGCPGCGARDPQKPEGQQNRDGLKGVNQGVDIGGDITVPVGEHWRYISATGSDFSVPRGARLTIGAAIGCDIQTEDVSSVRIRDAGVGNDIHKA